MSLAMMNDSAVSLLLRVDHFDAVAGREQLELLHCDHFLPSEVPSDQIFKLALCELKAAPFDQVPKLSDADFLRVLVLDAVEESFEELIVLVLVRELVRIARVEGAHQLAELVLGDAVWLTVHRILLQVFHQRVVEAAVSSLVFGCVVRAGQQLLHELRDAELRETALDGDVVVGTEVEK